MKQEFATLPNGLRIVFEPGTSEVIYYGYVVRAGTRHEAPGDSGMAHFIEHMSFKGTARRRAWHVNNYLERVGGSLNAYTNKQETVFHAAVLRSDFRRAADVLTDIVFRSTFPQRELEKEAEVVCDEIDAYRDTPSDLIFDEFEGMIFEGHPLGRDVLGDKARLRQYTREDLLRHSRRFFVPSNAVFFVYGRLDFGVVVRTLTRLTSDLPVQESPLVADGTAPFPAVPLSPYTPRKVRVARGTHQAHVLLGGRACSGRDEGRFALAFLTNLLGGETMNSRLNAALRERAGLVYTVDAYSYVYPDSGVWQVYFGCDAQDVSRCCRLVERELRRVIDTPLSPAQLAAAKKQQAGQHGIARENGELYAQTFGKVYANYGEPYDRDADLERMLALTAGELQDFAARTFDPAHITTLIYD